MILTDEAQNRDSSARTFQPKDPASNGRRQKNAYNKKRLSEIGQTLWGMKTDGELFFGGLQRCSSFFKA